MAKEFSGSRKVAWKGWLGILDYLKEVKGPIKVLDLGSGNSRLYSFLKESFNRDIVYFGLDQCRELVEMAENRYGGNKDFQAKEFDVIENTSSVNGKFDVVVAFGLTHHIPSEKLREEWFNDVSNLVSEGGLLILTFWNTSQKIEAIHPVIKDKDLDEGDKFLSWNNKTDALRYVHIYSDDEIELLVKNFKDRGLALVSKYHNDKNKFSENLYLIFRRD